MHLWEDPEVVSLLQSIVARGCPRYRRVFAAAGLECEPSIYIDGAVRRPVPVEVYHEFLLHLERRGVTLDTVAFPKAYFARAFRNFAEDLRGRAERTGLVYGDLEAGSDHEGVNRDGEAASVARAVRDEELNAGGCRRDEAEPGAGESFRRLGDFADRDQLHGLLENYPVVRDSEPLSQKLRTLYRATYEVEFPEADADELWDAAKAEEFGELGGRLDLVRGALSAMRERLAGLLSRGDEEGAASAGDRIETLLRREAEIARRRAYLLRLKPSHVLRILPADRRPTLNALTVALHRSRERMAACG